MCDAHLQAGLEAVPALSAVAHLTRAGCLPDIGRAEQVAHKVAAVGCTWPGSIAGCPCTLLAAGIL